MSRLLERRREFLEQVLRPREPVRLEQHYQPPAPSVLCCGESRLDLGRMVAVVVHHQHAAFFTQHLEPPLDSLEPGERLVNVRERHAQLQPDGDRRQRVPDVMDTRHRDFEPAQRLAAQSRRELGDADVELHVRAYQVGRWGQPVRLVPFGHAGQQRGKIGIVGAED